MANKENLPPRNEGHLPLDDDRSTPPGNVPATLGIRHWQRAAYTSPPFGLLSPNSKPSLARQRDHSACRRTDSPLKIRKTRENLKQASIYGDLPAPCMHASMLDLGDTSLPPSLSFTSATTVNSKCNCTNHEGHITGNDLTGSTLLPLHPHQADIVPPATSPPLQILGKPIRHKSVSRRMLSRVKEGISHRSRSSHATKSPEAETGLLRRLSGKQKTSNDEQVRLRSFEISRHSSIDSVADIEGDASASQPSFTDSSIATDELMATGVTLTPPSGVGNGSRQTSTHLLSPTPGRQSPYGGPTPRANAKELAVTERSDEPMLHACLPYIDMKVCVDREAVDVGVSKDVWVSIEAIVRSRAVKASATKDASTNALQRTPIDAIVVVCRDTLVEAAGIVQQCIVELCSRFDVADDRLALLVTTSRHIDNSTISCFCTQIHPLQAPKISALLERLGLAPSTSRNSLPEMIEEYPIQVALRSIATQANSKSATHAFVLSNKPVHLAQAIEHSMNWPSHLLKIGLYEPERLATPSHSQYNWFLEIRGEGDVSAPTLDNMFRDIRHGYRLGGIPSLRLCYKAMDRSRVVEVVGDKAVKDLRLGQRCSLFIKVCVPKIDPVTATKTESDQDSLFAELESLVGTLETNFLHVEARYRHTILPLDNVVTVRQICSIRRPKTESRWSLITSAVAGLSSEHVNTQLAQFLVIHHAPAKALDAIARWGLDRSHAVQQLCSTSEAQLASSVHPQEGDTTHGAPGPAVIITDTTQAAANASLMQHPVTRTASAAILSQTQRHNQLPHSASTSTMIATRIISAPKGTTAVSTYSPRTANSREGTPSDSNDTAHQLWQHLRRDSLSSKQMLAFSSENVERLEDEELKTLHGQALANKRSIGVDTLKAWKFKEDKTPRPAPWL